MRSVKKKLKKTVKNTVIVYYKENTMKKVVAIIVKNLFSENVLKSVFVKVGDYLVSSSKNKLDDKVWAVCKEKLL